MQDDAYSRLLLPSCRGGGRVVRTSCVRASAGTAKLRAKSQPDLVREKFPAGWKRRSCAPFFPFFRSPADGFAASNLRFCGKRSPYFYNGDHMSMYGVNASIPKTLIRHLVKWAAEMLV